MVSTVHRWTTENSHQVQTFDDLGRSSFVSRRTARSPGNIEDSTGNYRPLVTLVARTPWWCAHSSSSSVDLAVEETGCRA